MPTNETNLQSLSIEESYKVFVLFYRYMNDELPLELNRKVSHALESCEECQLMYEDMKLFFDDSSNVLHEMIYPDEVEETRRLLGQPPEGTPYKTVSTASAKDVIIASGLLEGECLCCGS